jgi:3-hydroxyacyl-CoA dehydrogenase
VIGTGVIGSSWTLFFLSRGLKVIVTDPAPGAKERLAAYLDQEWPKMQKMGLHEGASVNNYKFVDNIVDHLGEVDLVQEVRSFFPRYASSIHSPSSLFLSCFEGTSPCSESQTSGW